MAIVHPCPQCGKLIPVGINRCETCMARSDEERVSKRRTEMKRYYHQSRDPKILKFYRSKEWKTTSAAKLNKDRYCEANLDGCQQIACEVHHVKPLRTPEGWNERLEWENLMSVCIRCHNKLDNKWGKRNVINDKNVVDMRNLFNG